MPTLQIIDTGRPKRDIIEIAFEECGSAGYEFERTPEEIASALRKLDLMMTEWPFNGLGYAPSAYGAGQPQELSGIPDSAVNTVAMYLAMRIAPNMGATLSGETRAALTRSFNNLCSSVSTIPTQKLAASTPRGAGARGRSVFINEDARAADIDTLGADDDELGGVVLGDSDAWVGDTEV